MPFKLIVAILFLSCVTAVLSCKPTGFEEKSSYALKSLIPSYICDTIFLEAGNPFSKKKAALGRYLFYDRRLSINNTKACATCHAQEFSFTDSYARSIGALGDLHQRNAKPLINLVFERYLTSADSTLHYPEQQINRPMFNEHPIEMGWKGNEELILQRIASDKFYQIQFNVTFPGEKGPVTVKNIQSCISSFVKSIFSFGSAYDRYNRGDLSALSEPQKRGMALFTSGRLKCSRCHSGVNFSRPKEQQAFPFFNTGLYNIDGKGGYPFSDPGLYRLTLSQSDMGKFRVPTLRNLAFTAPYFHDGSAATLSDVIDVYEKGGRNILQGGIKGDGRINPYKSNLISGFTLNSQERADLISFLISLSDSSVLLNPAYANPFQKDETH
jgi:cytochrome c peroxidase